MVLRLEHRQNADGHVRIARAHPLDRFCSRHTGHLQIDQDQVRLEPGRRRYRLIAARCLAHDIEATILLQDFGDAFAKQCVVIHQQHADRHSDQSYGVSLQHSASLAPP